MARKINLDMSLLRTFVTGVHLGNFSHAAERLGRSQSTVSLQLRRLEEQTGSKLFDKNGRALVLNNQGEVLYRYAQRLLDLNDEAVAALNHQEVSGEIRLGIPPDLAETWLPKMLGRFSRTHPEVIIEARVDRNRSLLADLASNSLDIAIVWSEANNNEASSGTDVVNLPLAWISSRYLCLSPEAALPLVLMGAPCLFRQRALEALEASGLPWRIAFTSSSLAGVWAAVSAGLGVTVRTPVGVPQDLLSSPDLRNLKKLGSIKLRAHMCNAPSDGARRFFAILLETIGEQIGTKIQA